MKYALLFAATAAASYDAYGGYGGADFSSAPAQVSSSAIASSAPAYGGYGSQPAPSSKAPSPVSSATSSKATPCSTSVGQNGYTTVVPGYGKPPVTVTSQYQAIPTCVAQGYDSKSCAKWGEDKYVSTTLTDADKKVVTVTNVKDCVTVYHEKKTITHSATPTLGGYAAPSSYPIGAKNSTGTWYELYEKIHVVEYENIGKNALPGYGGSGLCHECDNAQPYTIKECKSGKCSEEKKTLNYGKPKDEVKVYEKPGVYTVPAKVVTVYPSAPTGPAGNGNGHPKAPEAGVYTYEAKTITITKPNQQYTCTYELPKQTPSKSEEYPASATKTPAHGEEYPVTKTEVHNNGNEASSTPKAPGNEYPSYPNVPAKSNSTSSAHGNGYGSAPSSTPCTESETHATPTPASSKPAEYGNIASSSAPAYGNTGSSSAPAYGDNGYGAHSTLVVASSSKPVEYGQPASSSAAAYNNGYGGEKPSASVPAKASSTPCESELKHTYTPAATATPYVPVYGSNKPSSSAPVYNGEKSSSAPVYGGNKPSSSAPAYAGSSSAPAQASSTPCESELKHSSTPAATPTPYVPVYGGNKPSSSAPVYNGQKSSSAPVYSGSSSAPAKASSTPCESESKHASTAAATPTPNAPVYGNNVPSSSASKPSTTPAPYIPVYGGNQPSSSAPAKASSTPCESDLKTSTATPAPTATPYVPVYGNNKPSSTVPAAASSTPCDEETKTPAATPYASAPAYGNAKPSPTPAAPVYNNNNSNGGYGGDNKPSPTPAVPAHTAAAAGGYGYAKRDNMMERRKRAAVL
ncbi:hypothetical protein HBH96_014200 [Parastagonospora nodorum]|nr:hypothetical protein HBH52_238880 [Parastagonospora nodorum]KAH5069389.1 hypothetical protein HBH96_014200 [Parastagonospora nodorum]KAH6422906.1 hypothetical protein HBI59_222760 [Parastagonospora nodorum]